MAIFISIIIGIIIFYKVIIPFVHNQYYPNTEKRITKGLLSMSFWQILFSALVCTYSLEVEPVYKQTDEDVNSFIQEYSEVGDLINEYTGINATSNFNYLMSEAESLHTYTIIFIIVAIILALATAIGNIGKKLDKRIVEGMSIITTLGCCWIAKSSTDLYELIIRDGATLQTIAWIGRLFGTDIYSAMDWIIRIIWLCPLILIIKHFFYHKTLDEYYAVSIPQSEAIKQKEENIIREERTVTEEQPDIESPKQSVPINQMEGSVIIEKQINEKTPEPGPINKQEKNSTLTEKGATITIEEPQLKVTEIEETGKKTSVPFNLLFGIGLVVLMGIVAWWILQSNEKEYSIQDIETISQQNQNTENYNPEVEGNTGATPQQRNENIEAPSTTNQFEYINEKRGNYEVDIEFPVSLAGMKDVSGIQLAIAQKAFDCNSNDINSCVKKYFKEGAESVSLGEGETAGKVTVKFQQRLNSLYVFKISTYADLGGGTGLSVIYRDEYIYFDKNMNRSLVINDLFNDYSQTLSLVNEHISLDEYASKAKELPENFIISSSGITFIFPKYSIGYGAQGEVEIALTYEELNNVLSDTFKNAIGK